MLIDFNFFHVNSSPIETRDKVPASRASRRASDPARGCMRSAGNSRLVAHSERRKNTAELPLIPPSLRNAEEQGRVHISQRWDNFQPSAIDFCFIFQSFVSNAERFPTGN